MKRKTIGRKMGRPRLSQALTVQKLSRDALQVQKSMSPSDTIYITGLINRLIEEYEPELREAFRNMMYTLQRDLLSDKPAVVALARKDLIRLLGYTNTQQEHTAIVSAVLHLPSQSIAEGIEVIQIGKR